MGAQEPGARAQGNAQWGGTRGQETLAWNAATRTVKGRHGGGISPVDGKRASLTR